MLKMKTTLAKKLFWVLVLGLVFLSLLMGIILYQIQDAFNHPAFNPVTQMKFQKIINNVELSDKQLQNNLDKVRGIEVKKISKITNRLNQLPVIIVGDYKFPVIMPGPFILKHQNSLYLIKFNRFFQFTLMTAIYILVLILLFLLAVSLCYWVIRAIEKPAYMVISALKKLSENIYADIKLSNDSEITKAISDDLYQLQNALKKALSSRTDMLAAISHDLKTPITRLKLRTELLDDEIAQKGLLKDIEEIEQMIGSIISFSKAFVNDERVVTFNLSELVESIAQNYIDMGFSIQTQLENHIQYKGRIVSIKRAVSNVLDNAVKYGKQNILLQLVQSDNYIHCVVSDTGQGIKPENFDKIIQPFFREDATRNNAIKGSGLGLSITSEILRSCGGNLKFEINQPSGLLVVIELPKQEKI